MLPDLGKYAFDVLLAYGLGLFLLVGLVVLSLWQSAGAARKLDAQERRAKKAKRDG